jgi:hypothetical protein
MGILPSAVSRRAKIGTKIGTKIGAKIGVAVGTTVGEQASTAKFAGPTPGEARVE